MTETEQIIYDKHDSRWRFLSYLACASRYSDRKTSDQLIYCNLCRFPDGCYESYN